MTQKQKSPNTAQNDIRVQLRERVATAAVKAYETNFSEGNFESAARIAKEHELGKKQMQAAAVRAYETSLSKGFFNDAARIAKEHELGEDIVEDTYALASLIRA